MPVYEYECEKCSHSFEITQGMNDKKKKKCPECKKHSLFRVIFAPHVSVRLGDNEVNVGHLGNRHRDEWSSDQKESLEKSHLTEKQYKDKKMKEGLKTDNPDLTKTDKEVRKMNPAQIKDYIENG